MSRMVKCVKLGKELPGIAYKPFDNELGQRIYDNVSQEAWKMWLEHSKMIVNEYRLDLIVEARAADPARAGRASTSSARARSCRPTTARPPPSECAGRRHLLVSSYELGHQPLDARRGRSGSCARRARAARARSGGRPLDEDAPRRARGARLVAISVPMHTALRLGAGGAPRLRAARPARAPLLLRALRAAQRARRCGAPGPTRARRRVRGGAGRAGAWRATGAPPSGAARPLRRLRFLAPIAPGCRRSSLRAPRPPTASGASPATSRRRAAACTSAATARSRRSTAAASSSCPSTSCSPTSARRSPPARATSPSAIPTS